MDQDIKEGQLVEWLTRPDGNGGYLKGTVTKVSEKRIGLTVISPKTGEPRHKWVEPRFVRPVQSELRERKEGR